MTRAQVELIAENRNSSRVLCAEVSVGPDCYRHGPDMQYYHLFEAERRARPNLFRGGELEESDASNSRTVLSSNFSAPAPSSRRSSPSPPRCRKSRIQCHGICHLHCAMACRRRNRQIQAEQGHRLLQGSRGDVSRVGDIEYWKTRYADCNSCPWHSTLAYLFRFHSALALSWDP